MHHASNVLDQTAVPSPTTTAALQRIAVAAPYFGFDDIERTDKGVRASVPPSPPARTERGAIAADQVARHLAILGSCAAALDRDDDARHHYLATKAMYLRVPHSPAEIALSGLQAEATARWLDKRSVIAETRLLRDGVELNRLEVRYAVLAPRMFERFNRPVEPADAVAPGDGSLTVVEGGDVIRDCGGVDPQMCAGHFPGFPAAPVALLMGRLVATTADALRVALGRPVDYRVENGRVEATGLAQAGQHLMLHASYGCHVGDGVHKLSGHATADGETVGTVHVRLRAFD